MRRNCKKTHKLTDFSPKPLLLHVISSGIRFDKIFYPVLIYANYLICIIMNIYANLKNDGKIIENKLINNDQKLVP